LLNVGQPDAAIEPLRRGIALFRETGSRGIPLAAFYLALAMGYHLTGRDEMALQALREGYPPHQTALEQGWHRGGWPGMNLALAQAVSGQPGPDWAQTASDMFVSQLYARAGARHDMYGGLEGFLTATGTARFLDRDAYRACYHLAEAVNAMIEYQPYWQEPRFRRIKRALDARIAACAGSSGHADPSIDGVAAIRTGPG
jgi:hypothetical protein